MKSRVYYYESYQDDFGITDNIKKTIVGDSYKYKANKIASFIWYYIIAMPIAFLLMKISFHYKWVNKKAVKKVKGGFFIYGNHTNFVGDALMPSLLRYKKNNIIVKSDTVSIKGIKHLVKDLGAMPLGETLKANKNLLKEMKARIHNGESITIYPEAHIWPYYTKIRPFKDMSFRYPIEYNKPVFSFTNVYLKRKHGKTPTIHTYIDGPFFPDLSISKPEARKKLRDMVYNQMVERSKENTVEIIKYIKKEESND